jgi:uncharacterized membrane protein YbhN (UPF0104 family)
MKYKGYLKYLFGIVIVYFLIARLYGLSSSIASYEVVLDYWFLCVALGLLLFSISIMTFNWYKILRFFGVKIRRKAAFSAMAKTLLAKYVPGSVWHLVGRMEVVKELGISRSVTGLSLVIEIIMNVLATFSLAFVFLVSNFFVPYYALVVVVFMIVLLHPSVIRLFIRMICFVTRRKIVVMELGYRKLFELYVLYLIRWAIVGVGFAFLVRAVYVVSFIDFWFLAGVFCLSWVLGFLVLFSPAGLGVREVVMVGLLVLVIPEYYAILISLVARLWWFVGEIVFTLGVKFGK